MGRPSLAEKRTTEILTAFERCVARFGLEGSSLDRIAKEAGMKRSILRHYVGNRDELITALAERVVSKYEADLAEHLGKSSHLKPVEQVMNYLFPKKQTSTAESLLVIESLIAASAESNEIQERMRGYIDRLIERVAVLLRQSFPQSSIKECWSVAYGVISICFNHESLTPLELPAKYQTAAKSTARLLIQSLDKSE